MSDSQAPSLNRRVDQYLETPTGLFYIKHLADGDVPIQLTNFRAHIVADVSKDDGVEVTRDFEIEAVVANRPSVFRVPSRQFGLLNWVPEQLGARAIVTAVPNVDKRVREAVQRLSADEIIERRLFTHTGWRRIDDEWGYLHRGGAITGGGCDRSIEVELPRELAPFELPDPIDGAELVKAIGKALQMLLLAPDRIIVPIFCAIYRAVLGRCDFALTIEGKTGGFKTEVVALMMQHFGVEFNSRNLPSWLSTANYLAELAFCAKDAPFPIDDFVPRGPGIERQRLNQVADQLIRGAGNAAGRGRMGSDLSLKPAKAPRGMIIITGEEAPTGASAQGRQWIIDVPMDAVDVAVLTGCQAAAVSGVYAKVMSSFLRWLAPQLSKVLDDMKARYPELRARASGDSAGHARTPGILADLYLGAEFFFRFAVEALAVSARESETWLATFWDALIEAAQRQADRVREQDPVDRFVELLRSAIASGGAHLAALDGSSPLNAKAWGWRLDDLNGWRSLGPRVGWIQEDDAYLDPDASYKAAAALVSDGAGISVSSTTLKRRLSERGFLLETGKEHGRETLTVRKAIAGGRLEVLHLSTQLLLPPEVEIEGVTNG